MKRTLIFLFIFFVFVSTSAKADNELVDTSELESAAPSEVVESIGGIDGATDTKSALSKLWDKFSESIKGSVSEILGRALAVISVSLICGILTVFREDKSAPDWIELAGCAAISALCFGEIGSYINICTDTLCDISAFSQTLLPVMCTLAAASGAVTSASVKFAASALFIDVFITAATELVLPVILAYMSLSAAAAAFDNKSLLNLSKFLKKLSVILMTLLASGFTAYLGISSAIASAGDALTLKAAKTAISTALPVVGGILSDAASSVIGGAELLKSTVGVFGMLAVAFICVTPFAILAVNYLVFKAASACVAMIGGDRLSQLTASLADAFGMLLGLIGCAGLMMYISLISAIKAVVI